MWPKNNNFGLIKMKKIYNKIWELTKPYYEKGRIYDIEQVTWMLKNATKITKKLKIDNDTLFPLIILHDVGYCVIKDKNPHLKNKNYKILHMKEGAKIAKQILGRVDYDSHLLEKIVYYVSVHDNWVLGDDKPFKESIAMALFNDLDFLYAQSSYDAFEIGGKSMGIKPEEMYNFWMNDEKLSRRPFCCNETKELFNELMKKRKKEIDAKNQNQINKLTN